MSSPAGGAASNETASAENKRELRDRSYAIDKQIEEDSKKYRKECKILLLGASSSLRRSGLAECGRGAPLWHQARPRYTVEYKG